MGFQCHLTGGMARLTDHEWLKPELRARVAVIRSEMAKRLAIGEEHGLKHFVTMDVKTQTPVLKQLIMIGAVDFIAALPLQTVTLI